MRGIDDERPAVLIAGGGVAALEACLALRAYLTDDDLRIALLSPSSEFDYRPLAVLEPFQMGRGWSMELSRFAADQDVALVHDALDMVEARHAQIRTTSGRDVRFDHLIVATGARAERAVPGATVFRGARDAAAVRHLVDRVRDAGGTLAFVVPERTFWTLPLYELAILAAARLADAGPSRDVALITPETAPLQAFGPRATAALQRLLDDRRIRFVGATVAVAADAGEIEVADGRTLRAAGCVALPRLRGARIRGLRHDADGFLPVDDHGRVAGCDGVFAAGDATSFPVKQGGLASQQADAAAEAILADLGFPIVPRPFRPVLHGVLYTDREPTYLREPTDVAEPAPRAYSLWWPPSKIAGRHLSPYLTISAGAPRAPEVRPDTEVVPVEIDVASHVHAVQPALGADALPPG